MAFRKYTVIYEPAEESGFYAHIPALEITTEGETLEEAKEMAKDAIDNTASLSYELPEPSVRAGSGAASGSADSLRRSC